MEYTMKLLSGSNNIEAAIISIQKRGKKLDHDIHVAGVSCLKHIEFHGDVTLLNRLVEALPKGSRTNAFKEWAEVHGKVHWSQDDKLFVYEKEKSTLLDEAIATSWVEYKPEPEYKPLDFKAELAKLLKKADERVNTKDKGDKVDKQLLADLNKMLKTA